MIQHSTKCNSFNATNLVPNALLSFKQVGRLIGNLLSFFFFCSTQDGFFTNYEKSKYLAFHAILDQMKIGYRNLGNLGLIRELFYPKRKL